MTFEKTLTNIALIGALTLGGVGCSDNNKFVYNGEMNGEEITFESNVLLPNVLIVKRKDGTIIKYYNTFSSISSRIIGEVEITKDGITKSYIDNDIGKEVLKEAQGQYENYLNRILMNKREEGLKNIKRN